jgi:hypothetical protein
LTVIAGLRFVIVWASGVSATPVCHCGLRPAIQGPG